MNNIKQNLLKFITSFYCLLIISGCESSSGTSGYKKTTGGGNITQVAILVPLSGENEVMGKQYAGLIKMGLGSGAKSKIKVTSYDSADELKLKESLKKILDQKTNIIIGPIYSRDTKIAANYIKGQDIIMLSLSNDPTLADTNVFVFGHAPMRQIEQITRYLLDNEYKNFITLLPIGRHSQAISKVIQNMIVNKGGTLSRMEFYDNSDEELARSVNIVSDAVDTLNEQEENLKRPVVLIGDDPENLKRIYALAKKFNLDKKAVIAGDNRLNLDSDEPFDIIYTGSIKIDNSNLEQKAAALGINHFSFMHALVYDAGNIIASLVGQHYNKSAFLLKLNSPEKFQGLSGNIYFIDSIAMRQYDIIKKHNGVYSVMEAEEKKE